MLALFGKNIESNICTIVTFSDGQKPKVLDTLKKLKIPYMPWFPFNNAGLFADTSDEGDDALLELYWKTKSSSFNKLMQHIAKLRPVTLDQTLDVLEKRKELEHTQTSLQRQVKRGLRAINAIEKEIQLFKMNEKIIETGCDFVYQVQEDIEEVKKIPREAEYEPTNCKNCRRTCHEECPHDEKTLHQCIAMDNDGYCMICPESCHFTQHKKSDEIISWTTKPVQKSYKDVQTKMNAASHHELIMNLQLDIEKYEKAIAVLMNMLKEYNNELAEKALRHNPKDVFEYFEQVIEAEKGQKASGYRERIQALENCKRRMEVHEEVNSFLQQATDAKNKLHVAFGKGRKEKSRGFIGRFLKVFKS